MTWATTIVAEDEDERPLKERFAAWFVRYPGDAFRAACSAFPDMDAGRQLFIATAWPRDPVVMSLMSVGVEEGDIPLPTKEQVAAEILETARSARSAEDKFKGYKLYGEFMGHIEKPGAVVNNNVTVNKVMTVKDHGSNEAWEAKLARQQSELTSANATQH